MNNLAKRHLINKETLDPANYLQSMVQEAHRLGLLSDDELASFQLRCMELLAERMERYTGGYSSSVREETAQNIFASTLFTMSVYLKSLPDPDLAVELLRQEPLINLYKQGEKLVKQQVRSAKERFDSMQNRLLDTDNIAYNDTVQKGIPMFFAAYDAEFAAHDTPASIDYPLSNDKLDLVGVEYITAYLEKLDMENRFCMHFAAHDVVRLLRAYDAHYQDLLINIFGIVLVNALGAVLAGKDPIGLKMEPVDVQYLQGTLDCMSLPELRQVLQDATNRLIAEMHITNAPLQKHIRATTVEISAHLKHALEKKQLDTQFVSVKPSQSLPVIKFTDGERMDDEVFRQILDEIRECRYVSDKFAIIKREIHSITDLTDMLEGYCLFDDEFVEVFQELGDTELALLYKRLSTHVVDSDHHYTENEKEWHNWLRHYLEATDLSRGAGVKALAERIELS